MESKLNVLVLCTGNSCRSQMAEGFLRKLLGDKANVYSAGIETHGVNSRAILSMEEKCIDITSHTSNHVDEYAYIPFDVLLTVCDNANEKCPVFPSRAKKFHYNFPDPAKAIGTEEEIMKQFARTRDLIQVYCEKLVKEIS
jgi:arsenate reductase (thioredoxin)